MRRAAAALTALLLSGCAVVATPEPDEPGPSPPRGAVPGSPTVEAPAPSRPPAAVSRTMTPVRHFPEVRGLWVVRTSMTSAASIRRMVDDAAAAGFNTLILQVRGRGDAFYRSRWEPQAETIRGGAGFDPLALAVEEAHARGMAVHAWVNTLYVWGSEGLPESRDHLVRAHPDWLAVPRELGRSLHDISPTRAEYVEALQRHARANAASVEGLYASPSHPEVQERVYSIWVDLVERYDLDGLHFDYVRLPNEQYDYSAGALTRFRAWVEPRLPRERVVALRRAVTEDPFAFVDALPDAWDEFRRAQITALVRRIYYGVKARRPESMVSAAVFADRTDAYRQRFQDWGRWLEEGILDVAVPMAYTPSDGLFRSLIRDARSTARERERVWAGVGAYLNGPEGTLGMIDIAREEGAGGVVLFSYDWAVTEGSPAGSVPFLRRVGAAAFNRR